MASPRGCEGGRVNEANLLDPALPELMEEPWRFEFHQAVRVLLRNSEHGRNAQAEGSGAIERRYHQKGEPVHIGAHQSLGFPASDIQALTLLPDDSGKLEMLVNCFGLTGPSGVLPLAYTEFLIDREVKRDAGPAAFLDIFNHRLAMLFHYAWEKYRFQVIQESRPDHDFFSRILLSLATALARSICVTASSRRMHFSPDTRRFSPSSPAPRPPPPGDSRGFLSGAGRGSTVRRELVPAGCGQPHVLSQ